MSRPRRQEGSDRYFRLQGLGRHPKPASDRHRVEILTTAAKTCFASGKANVLSDVKRQQILALGRLGWSLRRIQQALAVRRETASAYLKAAGIPVRPPRTRRPPVIPDAETEAKAGHHLLAETAGAAPQGPEALEGDVWTALSASSSKPASQVSTDLHDLECRRLQAPGRPPTVNACEPHREFIEESLV